VELCTGDFENRLAGQACGARAVHQDIDSAEFACAPVDQRIGDRRVGRRTGVGDRAVDACRGFCRCVCIASVDDDTGAEVGQECGDRQPDAARSADDDGAAAGQ